VMKMYIDFLLFWERFFENRVNADDILLVLVKAAKNCQSRASISTCRSRITESFLVDLCR
jgi:hypothetical protein